MHNHGGDYGFFGGCSYPEITAMTGIPLGTVKTRAHSAVARLRLQLGDLTDLG